MTKNNYDGLNITLLGASPIFDLYSHPVGKTVVLMTDEHSHSGPVLFAGPVLGGHHFLEARQRKGRLEIISAVIQTKDLGLATARSVGLVPELSKGKEADRQVGLFDYTAGRGAHVYQPEDLEYSLLFEKLKAVGLTKWAKANPYE